MCELRRQKDADAAPRRLGVQGMLRAAFAVQRGHQRFAVQYFNVDVRRAEIGQVGAERRRDLALRRQVFALPVLRQQAGQPQPSSMGR